MKTFKTNEYKRILAFIHNEMDPKERDDFRSELREDSEKFEEVQEVRRLLKLSKDVYYEDKVRRLITPVKIAPMWQRPAVWMAAASTALILGFGVWFLFKTGENADGTNEKVIAKQEKNYELSASEMSGAMVMEPLKLADVPAKFKSELESLENDLEPAGAITRLENFGRSNAATAKSDSGEQLYGSPEKANQTKSQLSTRDDGYRLLLLGVGYLKQENAEKALNAFNRIKYDGLAQNVRWYKALAYLQKNDNVKAKEELLKITDNRYKADAKELLDRLP